MLVARAMVLLLELPIKENEHDSPDYWASAALTFVPKNLYPPCLDFEKIAGFSEAAVEDVMQQLSLPEF